MSDATHAPPPHADGRPAEEHPEVAFEPRDANIRIIVITGVILVVAAVVIHLVLWGMFYLLEAHHNAVKEVSPPLVRQEANQPPQGPPLEGNQAHGATLTVQAADGTARTFGIDGHIPVVRNGETRGPDHEYLNVFDLGIGTEVTVVYEPPAGHEPTQAASPPVAQVRAVSVITPPQQEEQAHAAGIHVRGWTGRITKLVAVSPDFRHLQAKAELSRPAGWVDRKGGIAHIPLDQAMQAVADEGGTKSKQGKGTAPGDARGGAAPVGGRP